MSDEWKIAAISITAGLFVGAVIFGIMIGVWAIANSIADVGMPSNSEWVEIPLMTLGMSAFIGFLLGGALKNGLDGERECGDG